MAQSFNCPNCGGALDYAGSGRTMKCPYCATTVPVPEEFWREQETAKAISQGKKYVIIFLLITVGLPTCLGLFGLLLGFGGTLLGIAASLLAIIVQILVRVFVH